MRSVDPQDLSQINSITSLSQQGSENGSTTSSIETVSLFNSSKLSGPIDALSKIVMKSKALVDELQISISEMNDDLLNSAEIENVNVEDFKNEMKELKSTIEELRQKEEKNANTIEMMLTGQTNLDWEQKRLELKEEHMSSLEKRQMEIQYYSTKFNDVSTTLAAERAQYIAAINILQETIRRLEKEKKLKGSPVRPSPRPLINIHGRDK